MKSLWYSYGVTCQIRYIELIALRVTLCWVHQISFLYVENSGLNYGLRTILFSQATSRTQLIDTITKYVSDKDRNILPLTATNSMQVGLFQIPSKFYFKFSKYNKFIVSCRNWRFPATHEMNHISAWRTPSWTGSTNSSSPLPSGGR